MSGIPKPVVCACAVLVATSLAGCQRAGNPVTEAAIDRATRGQLEAMRDGARAVAHDAGAARHAGHSLPLPESFPGDVYLPSGYRVDSVMDLQDVHVLGLSAPGEVASLFADARQAMRAQGWKQTLAAQHSVDAAMLAFEKPDATGLRSTTLSFNRNHGDGHVIVGVQLRRRML